MQHSVLIKAQTPQWSVHHYPEVEMSSGDPEGQASEYHPTVGIDYQQRWVVSGY